MNQLEDPETVEALLEGEFFIGSDGMVRNLSKRVEVVTRVFRRNHKEQLRQFLGICLGDRRQVRALEKAGAYTQLRPDEGAESEESDGGALQPGAQAGLGQLARTTPLIRESRIRNNAITIPRPSASKSVHSVRW
jgi:hypothetical protein